MTERRERPPPRHGGDLGHATAVHGLPADGWLDLSTGINPHPYPVPGLDAAALTRLPAADAVADLIDAARKAYRVPPAVAVLGTPGSEIALRLLPLVAPAGPVAIVSPTYGSHREAWENAGRQVVVVPGLDRLPSNTGVVVVASPNNPDGRVADPAALATLAKTMSGRNALLVVDEAFADLVPDASIVRLLQEMNAVVLRSFGKFFGLPGLRLGFVVGAPALVTRLAALLGDWPVSAPALSIGAAALSDLPWQAAMRQRLAGDARRLRELLGRHRLAIAGGTDLFVLVEDREAGALHHRLAQQGIWTRAFVEHPTWLRIGLPGDPAGFIRLDRALSRG